MQTQFKPFRFDEVHDAALLNAAGYTYAFWPATWEDIGGPESGPKLHGYPDTEVWTLRGEHSSHEIVVIDGQVVEASTVPNGPEGWEEQF
jgi:hypothetical protein